MRLRFHILYKTYVSNCLSVFGGKIAMICLFFIYTEFSNSLYFLLYIMIIGLTDQEGRWTPFSKYIWFDWIPDTKKKVKFVCKRTYVLNIIIFSPHQQFLTNSLQIQKSLLKLRTKWQSGVCTRACVPHLYLWIAKIKARPARRGAAVPGRDGAPALCAVDGFVMHF